MIYGRLPTAHPPHRLVVNIALVDVSEENGSTELWPGSHRDTAAGGGIMPGGAARGAAHSCSAAAAGRIFARPILLEMSKLVMLQVKANVRPCHIRVSGRILSCAALFSSGLWFECTND